MSPSLINGLPADQISVADRGLSYGDGLFETIQINAGKALLWDAHVDRLKRGAERLSIPFDDNVTAAFLEDIEQLLTSNASFYQRSVAKITLTRGIGKRGYKADPGANVTRISSLSAMPDMQQQQQLGINVILCRTALARQPLLAGIKHLNRLEQVIARNEWSDPQISEGIVCDTQGYLIEGCMSNLCWVSQGVLHTPNLEYAGVAGVVRDTIIKLCEKYQILSVVEGDYRLSDLLKAEEIFVCNSVFNILPVVRLYGNPPQKTLKDLEIGFKTKELQEVLQQYYLRKT